MRLCQRCGTRFPDDHSYCPVDGTVLQDHRSKDWLIGSVLNGTYRVKELIAEGGMTSIFLADNVRIGKEFALKVLDPTFVQEPENVERFFNEARAAAALGHPGVVEIFDCVLENSGIAFMVMTHLEGEDVERMLNALAPGSALELSRAMWIASQTAEVLAVAHSQNIVHRDIKPANLFVAQTYRGGEQVKVFDFGVARLMSAARVTHSAMILGTPEYMSPEQAKGEQDIDHRSDIYSLGASLYHMLCGRPPFQGESPVDTCIRVRYDNPIPPRELRPDMPLQLESLIMWMLEKNRTNRPQNAAQVQYELESVVDATQPPEVLDTEADEEPTVAGAEVRIVTALVADIEPPSTVDIEQQVDATGHAFNTLAEAVTAEGGVVGHLAGSRAVGVFGMFMSFGDEPLRAVRAAVRIQRKLRERRIVRVAVGTGRTVVPADSVTTGPAAAAAARLLARVEYGEIAIDPSTYRRIRGSFRCRKIDVEPGQPGAFRIAELVEHVGLRSTATAFGRSLPTIGRRDELGHIVSQFDRSTAARCPTAVTVTGPPGVGKTRLKTDFVVKLSSSDAFELSYLEGAGQGWDRVQPFAVLADLLRRRSRLKADLDEEKARARVEALVKESGVKRSPKKMAELLAFAAGIGPPRTPSLASLSAELLHQRTIDAFVQLVCSMTQDRAVVLCVEDAESIDEASLEALARLCAAAEQDALFLLLIGRPECWEKLSSSIRPLGGHLRIQLPPLSFDETREFIKGLLGSEPPSRLLDAVWERTKGIPLFIEEVLFALRQQGSLAPLDKSKGWILVESADLSTIPATVEGLVFAQLDALPQGLKDAARRAAVLGTIFWDEAVKALGIQDTENSLAELAGRDLIVVQQSSALADCREYAFRSPMLAEVAYHSVPHREREALHLRAAEWLQRRGAAPVVIAFHLARAGRALDAAKLYIDAGDAAAGSYTNQEALASYTKAIELCADPQLSVGNDLRPANLIIEAQFGKARVLSRLASVDEAIASLEAAEVVAGQIESSRAVADAAVRKGALLRTKEPAKAVEVLRSALELSKTTGHADLECRALLEISRASASGGDLKQGSRLASKAVNAARKLRSAALVRQALVAQGAIETERGNIWLAAGVLTEALDITRHASNPEQEAEILSQLGYLRSELGDLQAAEDDLLAALDVAQKTQNRRAFSSAQVNLGWVYWKQGRQEEAWNLEREALGLSKDSLGELCSRGEVYLALFELGDGRVVDCIQRCRRVGAAARSSHHTEQYMLATMVEALAHRARGKEREAADLVLRAISIFNTLPGTTQFEVELHLVASLCLLSVDHIAEAHRVGQLALNAIERRVSSIDVQESIEDYTDSVGVGLPPEVREILSSLKIGLGQET